MRYIAVFLLLANIGYFGWHQYHIDPDSMVQSAVDRPLLNNGLMLISEFNQQAEQQARINEEARRVCSVISGFSSVDDANSFITQARQRGLGVQLHLTGDPLEPQYRVLLPPSSSRTIATITLDGLSERIRQAGLEIETYIITRGALENAIALGVFLEMDSATEVRNQVLELGYSVEIEEIQQSTGDIQVLLTPLDSGQIENPQWLGLTVDRPYLTRTENLCETIAQGAQFP